MREILFRGKLTDRFKSLKIFRPNLINNDFVYGSLVIDCDNRTYICVSTVGCQDTTYINNGTTTMFEVIPETVGQYTGLTDKNEKKIFEGDILRDDDNEENGVVEFDEGEYFVVFGNVCTHGITDIARSCYVIGNIHDNPELLEVQ